MNRIFLRLFSIFIIFVYCLDFVPIAIADEREGNIEKFKQEYNVQSCEENYCILRSRNALKYAIANPNSGELLTPIIYDEITPLSPAYALKIKYCMKYALYDLNTNKQTRTEFEDIRINQKDGKYFFEYKYDGKWRKMRGVRLKKAQETAAIVAMSPLLIITAPIWGLYLYGFYNCFMKKD